MKKTLLSVGFIVLLTSFFPLFAQEYYRSDKLRFEDCIYKESIKSLVLSHPADMLTLPVVTLNSGEQLLLQFDELAEDYRSFRFTYIHCDAMWNPTADLLQQEFLNGMFEDDIYEYAFSFNTIQDYIHYQKLLPSEKMLPKLSGNYLLVAYEDGTPEDPFFSLRFMVLEPKISVAGATVHQDQRPATHLENQRLSFKLDVKGYNVPFPERDLKVMVRQNERWDNVKYLKPLNYRGDVLDFNYYNDENVFKGLNQHRSFDIKTLKTNTINVGRIRQDETGIYYVGLLTDIPRPHDLYKVAADINGKFLLKTEDYDDTNLQAEYAWVFFFLKTDVPVSNGTVHIMGTFTQNRLDASTEMKYNYNRKGYEISMYLKQGYYEYMYGWLEEGMKTADVPFFEGTHWEASNDYYIYVYHQEAGDKHDRLIAFEKVSFR